MPDKLPAGVQRPDYDPRTVTTGMVHLGLGNFHRAHQAVYTDAVLADDPTWGICGVSLRTRGVVDALAAQQHRYTLLERGPDGTNARVIEQFLPVRFLMEPLDSGTLVSVENTLPSASD